MVLGRLEGSTTESQEDTQVDDTPPSPGGRPVPVQQRLGGFTEHFVPTDLHLVIGQRLLLETAE